MAVSGYMNIAEIPGESGRKDHEDEIIISSVQWGVTRPMVNTPGVGRSTGMANVSSITVTKLYDKSSPYLAQAVLLATAFPQIAITLRKDSGETHLDYLTIGLSDCMIESYHFSGASDVETPPMESISIVFNKVHVLYIEQASDHSAGGEHEFEYDLIAGA
ncbi:MAG: type VI secretion system tube protein Hcp [Tabrizicola sp.]